ncbi:dyrk2, partial [Symbiodinium pilosum]
VLEYLGSAAFSRAVQCLDLENNRMVCMKIINNNKDFLDQSLDEIKLLRLIRANVDNIDDKNCLALVDYFYHKEHLIIVTELLRDNLYEFSKYNREACEEPYFTLGRLQRISKQILVALEYIHQLYLIHADLKPENILIKSYSRCEVKVIDFGSSCFVDDQLTNYVQSRSYRTRALSWGLFLDSSVMRPTVQALQRVSSGQLELCGGTALMRFGNPKLPFEKFGKLLGFLNALLPLHAEPPSQNIPKPPGLLK